MLPPPTKRIKRPPKVLDEEEYTAALSDIIARDFFPGLVESKAQQEYMNALEANDEEWIRNAGRQLTETMTPRLGNRRARATRFDPSATPQLGRSTAIGEETPKGWGGETPSVAGTDISRQSSEIESKGSGVDTSSMRLSEFQRIYTSEDNESFNALLDKQNEKRREKHAYMWNNNKILAPRQLLHRAREAKLITSKSTSDDKALIPLTTGATSDRPAQPTAWKSSDPENSFMFNASSVEDDYETVAQKAEATSRAAPKQTVYSNTRFQPPPPERVTSIPPSPSLSAVREAIAGRPRLSSSEMGSDVYTGAETPRVKGYAFVDEDEPEPEPLRPTPTTDEPSYRDLLAGQADPTGPNPFTISENRRREDLHHRMVERTARAQREKRKQTIKTPVPKFPSSPMIGIRGGNTEDNNHKASAGGMMTPAARKLMERMGGRTPVISASANYEGAGSSLRNMWTPTPKRRN